MTEAVFVNGTFDVLHTGHLNLLEFARSLGGFLLVAVDSDERVKLAKGANRPKNTLKDRVRMLEAWHLADKVVAFSSDQELWDIMYQLSAASTHMTMVKGDDYKDKPSIGEELCDSIIYIPRNEQSTTRIVGR